MAENLLQVLLPKLHMLDLQLRQVKEAIFIPFCRIVGRSITPTQLTIIGFIFGLLSPLCLSLGYFIPGAVFWIINRIFDGMDGTVARLTNQQTDFGGYIDILCDFVIYALIPISIVYQQPSFYSYLIVSLLQATFFVNAASLMFLSSVLEKRAAKAKGFKFNFKECYILKLFCRRNDNNHYAIRNYRRSRNTCFNFVIDFFSSTSRHDTYSVRCWCCFEHNL